MWRHNTESVLALAPDIPGKVPLSWKASSLPPSLYEYVPLRKEESSDCGSLWSSTKRSLPHAVEKLFEDLEEHIHSTQVQS